MRSLRGGWLLLGWLEVSACDGGSGTVPISQIPPDKKPVNPCDIISLGLSMSAAVDYVNATPGCNGLADCVVSIN